MRTSITLLTGVILLGLAAQAHAEITISDPYARASRPGAPTGAAFMTITNDTGTADRLVSVASDVAARVELHTHIDAGNGVMQMREVETGLEIPAGASHALKRGGDHVMFMGLTQDLVDGESISVTLTFEQAGDVIVEIPVDNDRKAAGGHGHGNGHGDHSGHGSD